VSVLDEILSAKRSEVAARRRAEPERLLWERAAAAPPPRDFAGALRGEPPAAAGFRVIAELKRASPSRGSIRPGADAAAIARAYAEAGAAALSVLTDRTFFDGGLEDLARARAASELPVLRKDFILDPYQVWEARAAGADAVLLIASALDDRAAEELGGLARELGMAALFEVHDREEMLRARRLGATLVGINNRDLRTLEVRLATTFDLLELRAPGTLLVSESGFSRREEMEEMQKRGVDAFLIGERLMAAPDPGEALRAITLGRPGARGRRGEEAPCG